MMSTFQKEHKTLLRPTLGHPHNSAELGRLCEQEGERRGDYLAGVEENAKALRVSIMK